MQPQATGGVQRLRSFFVGSVGVTGRSGSGPRCVAKARNESAAKREAGRDIGEEMRGVREMKTGIQPWHRVHRIAAGGAWAPPRRVHDGRPPLQARIARISWVSK